MKKIVLFSTTLLFAIFYSFTPNPLNLWWHLGQKPFVLRQLVPILGSFIPVNIDLGERIVVFIFCIGLLLVTLYLYQSHWKQSLRNDLAYVLAIGLVFTILTQEQKVYDIPAAFFFTLILVLWEKGKFALTIPLYALSCLNRETTILLCFAFAVLYFRKMGWEKYVAILLTQIFLSISIWELLLWRFSDVVGRPETLNIVKNIVVYSQYPYETFVFLFSVLMIGYTLYKRRNEMLYRFAVYLLPLFVLAHFVSGFPFEFRVFSEIAPTALLATFLK